MQKKDDRKKASFARCVFYGAVVGFITIFVLFALFSALVTGGRLSQDSMKVITLASGFIGALIGSIIAIRKYKSSILTTGLTTAFSMFFVMALGSAMSAGKGMFAGLTPLLLVASMLGGIAAVLLGLRKVKKGKSRS